MVLKACEECLENAIVGVDNLELYLKRQHHPESPLTPALITYQNEKLNRVHGQVDLRKFDALYFEADKHLSASKEKINGDDGQCDPSGAERTQTQVLEPSAKRGSSKDEGFGAGAD